MPRYYYTDPLHAVYMNHLHGIEYANSYNDILEDLSRKYIGLTPIGTKAECSQIYQKYYIHPDSLPLLEPKDGDKDEDGYVCDQSAQGWFREEIADFTGETVYAAKPESVTTRRDNKAFFMPEVE